jgi:hypothetical protein
LVDAALAEKQVGCLVDLRRAASGDKFVIGVERLDADLTR